MDTFIPYVAGFFDGEGSINITNVKRGAKTYPLVQVSIIQSQRDILEEIQSRYGGRIYDHTSGFSTKPCFRLQLQRQDEIVAFLRDVRPFLRIKYRRADEALAVIGTPRSRSDINSWITQEISVG